ncbi:SagB/ThcOx family dehydrogenase [Bordetella genomosp. 13]|uniref:SagB/ThcOx family dehydrogenase n=1 Tax=Bordetella genomosp. 13 TaxID=463040 RepID=UPI0021B538C5|nr:SagB/ThcOx family dehydrogenase [Bordetella genomosp. 13]
MPFDMPPDAADDTPSRDAPLFHLFWRNSELNPARAAVLGQRIARDAAGPAGTPPPRHGQAAWPLPDAPPGQADTWARRASARAFGTRRATLPELGQLLHPLRARPGGQTRLLPSGGAKYPLQAYVALCRLDGPSELSGQIAWYDNERHGLAPVRACPPWPELARALGVDWPDEPAAVVMLVAQAEPMLAKYGERGGRFMLIEAGVQLGALGYQVAQAGWAGCAIGAFHDDALLALLGLRAPRHLAVLAYACGPQAR